MLLLDYLYMNAHECMSIFLMSWLLPIFLGFYYHLLSIPFFLLSPLSGFENLQTSTYKGNILNQRYQNVHS